MRRINPMNFKYLKFALIIFLLFLFLSDVNAEDDKSFSPYVDSEGGISLPEDFRENWEFLGAWVVPELPDGKKTDGYGFHDVFASPGTAEAYKNGNDKFKDGTVLIKEIRSIKSGAYTTGPKVFYANDKILWFVMIKDQHGRFAKNANWGDGWGWALFMADDPSKNVSTDYKKDCLGCHIPAKKTGWVYTEAYPTLK